jgi:hypothetical protein
MYRSRIFGFQYAYPQGFLDRLAKEMGFKWTKCSIKIVDASLIEIKPMSPPSSILWYCDFKYKKDE